MFFNLTYIKFYRHRLLHYEVDFMNEYYLFTRQINDEIKKIPKKNRFKFQNDYIKLIKLAQKDNYEDFNFS